MEPNGMRAAPDRAHEQHCRQFSRGTHGTARDRAERFLNREDALLAAIIESRQVRAEVRTGLLQFLHRQFLEARAVRVTPATEVVPALAPDGEQPARSRGAHDLPSGSEGAYRNGG
jgi:hypothetical protein